MSSKILNIAKVAGSDFFASLTLFPLHHVQKPSTIHHQTGVGLVSKVEWISQSLKASVAKAGLVFLCSFLVFVAKQGQWDRS